MSMTSYEESFLRIFVEEEAKDGPNLPLHSRCGQRRWRLNGKHADRDIHYL
jgi:hypothetical protein